MTEQSRVLIVGAGPTGLSLAILLRARGHHPVIIDRRSGPNPYPAAHVVNTRTQEIFAELGVADRIQQVGDPTALYGEVRWGESLAGVQFGSLQIPLPPETETGPLSPFVAVNIPQTRTEAVLVERFTELGGRIDYAHALRSVTAGSDDAPATVQIEAGGKLVESEFDLVIGCDGAASTVRRSLDIAMAGPRTIARFMTIYFEADLDAFVADHPAMLYWIGGRDARGVFISFDKPARTWDLLVPIGDLPDEMFDDATARALIRKAVGNDDVDIDLLGLSSWNMSAQVAESYGRGRVILAGDACHRFPPTGGLGMNTGVQDAHNLAWKICAVLEGEASFELLDTYEEERRPVALKNTAQSVHNLEKMGLIDDALGIQTLAPIDADAAERGLSTYDDDVLGLVGTSPAASSKRRAVQDAIDQQGEHFGQGGELDLGFTYVSRAITPDESSPRSGTYLPDARPGERLPFVSADGSYQDSTLSRIAQRGVTLFAAAPEWNEIAVSAAERTGVAVTVVTPSSLRVPEDWHGRFGISPSGAVAVRPDGHVFWRAVHLSERADEHFVDAVERAFLPGEPARVGHIARGAAR